MHPSSYPELTLTQQIIKISFTPIRGKKGKTPDAAMPARV
jgi:hypothetical protein